MTKKDKLKELFKNEYFVDIIIEDFINNGTKELVLTQNLDDKKTIDELKARQILRNYFDIILNEHN